MQSTEKRRARWGVSRLFSLNQTISLITSAVVILPLLILLGSTQLILLTCAGLIATAVAVPPSAAVSERVGSFSGAVLVILFLVVFRPGSGEMNTWALAFPGALLMLRPSWGLSIGGLLLGAMVFVPDGTSRLGEGALIFWGAAIVSTACRWLCRELSVRIYGPVSAQSQALMRLFSIFILAYFIQTIYFGALYYSLSQISPEAFSVTAGSPAIADYFVFSAMVGASGEITHLTPVSGAARVGVLSQMILSFLFTAVYLAILAGTLVRIRAE